MPSRGERRLTNQGVYKAVALAGFLVVAGLVFQQLTTLLMLVIMTILIAIPTSAIATWLQHGYGLPRPLAAVLALLGELAVVGGIIAALVPSFVNEVNQFVNTLPHNVNDLYSKLHAITGANRSSIASKAQQVARDYTNHPLKLLGPAASIGLGVVGALGALIVMVISALYMAMNPTPLINGAVRLFPPARRQWALDVMSRIRIAWIGWLRGLAIAMLVIGVLVYVGLQIVGLEYAVFFAVLSALFEVVPYFGALISGAPAVALALTHSPGKALAVLIVYVVAHQVDGNIVSPLVMARAVRLHPAVIAIGVIVAEQLFGILGLIIAVPLIAAFIILVEEIWVKPNEHAQAGVLVPAAPAMEPPAMEEVEPADGGRAGASETPHRSAS
jgi:predicted PurR-regulated permease PerM